MLTFSLINFAQYFSYAVDRSMHCMTIDGDTSTNDSVVCLANGLSRGGRIEDSKHPNFIHFRSLLTEVAQDLAKKIVLDGEGATKFVAITVRGAHRLVTHCCYNHCRVYNN